MRQINLLPPELKPSRKLGSLLRKGEKYFIAFIILYLILLGSDYAFKNYLERNLTVSLERKTGLSNELKSLANVETSSVYIRDRIEKYNELVDKHIEKTNLDNFEKSVSLFPINTVISTVEISDRNIKYKVEVPDNASFATLLNNLSNSSVYKQIKLSNLSFEQDAGYAFNLEMIF